MSDQPKYEDLLDWQQAFYDLNMKIGNEAWGAKLEEIPGDKPKMKIFINDQKWKSIVLKETNGVLAGYELIFEVYSQDEYAKL